MKIINKIDSDCLLDVINNAKYLTECSNENIDKEISSLNSESLIRKITLEDMSYLFS